MEHKIDNISQNAMCPHENDLETVKSAEVNQGVLMASGNPLYLRDGRQGRLKGKRKTFGSQCSRAENVKIIMFILDFHLQTLGAGSDFDNDPFPFI